MSYKLDLRIEVASMFWKLETKQILEKFKDKPISRRAIFRVLRDCREGKGQKNKTKSGRPPALSDNIAKILLSSATNEGGQSLRKLSKAYGVSQQTVGRI